MSMNIRAKSDYSYLFSSMGSTSSGGGMGNLNFLSEYKSIKNGSYGKLLKAYYNKLDKESNSTSGTKDKDNSSKLTDSLFADSAKKLTAIDSAADKLKESADALINKGKDSLFKEKNVTVKNEDGTTTTSKQYDMDAIYKSVSSFVNNYNSLVKASANSGSASVSSAVSNMTNITSLYSKTLEKVGITVGLDNKLSIDEDKFKAADINTLKTTFNNSPSFAYSISSQASFIDFAAAREASKANTYNYMGNYNNSFSSGNIFNSFF